MDIASNAISTFMTPAQIEIEHLIELIDKKGNLREDGTKNVLEKYFDTFDWLLYGNGLQLKKRSRNFYLNGAAGTPVLKGPAINRKRFFFWDVNAENIREKLRPVSNIRALTEILEVRCVHRIFSLLNKDRKTVVRLSAIESRVMSGNRESELRPMICLEPVKGYEKQFKRICTTLKDLELEELGSDCSFLDLALDAVGKSPHDYSSKFSLHLDKAVNVRKAVSDISLYLATAMEKNFHGIVDDIDSEFLHDFRIAVRRTRSLLSQLKKTLPEKEFTHFQSEFKWLGSITGPVRDLDVYLLMKEEYRSMLPKELYAGLTEFFDDLEEKRKERFAEMHKGLTSKRYISLMSEWKKFLIDEDYPWPGGNLSCFTVANDIIRKRFKRIIKSGGKITNDSPDQDLHSLRIHGKKLRYLLEFFRPFYNQDDIDFFLKQLKKLQNNLGDFNDISVQLNMLSKCRDALNGRNKRSIKIAASIGGLVAHLHDHHQQIRKKFESSFSGFASPDNIERFTNTLQ